MSIRNLTAKLLEEAEELAKRARSGVGEQLSSAGDTTSSDLPQRKPSVLEVAQDVPEATENTTSGLQERPVDHRWGTPGGIVARFKLPEMDPVEKRMTMEPLGVDVTAEMEAEPAVETQDPTTGDKPSPITIELKSH